ncbi:MAG: hypothetical protein RIE73_08045 [Coleofasciculus sp. C1-SOL-03]
MTTVKQLKSCFTARQKTIQRHPNDYFFSPPLTRPEITPLPNLLLQ